MAEPSNDLRRAGALALAAAALLLAAPTVLAFRTGGFIDQPRLIAGVAAWLLVLLAVVTGRPPIRGRSGAIAAAGLVLLAIWVGLSIAWAPNSDRATDDFQRLLLYAGALLAALSWLGDRTLARLAEPVLALGAWVTACYALLGRLIPQVVEQDISGRALGRLEQPLTYWNAVGVLCALGVILCARLAGDGERARRTRAAGAGGAVALGAALYLTYSRGSLAALAVGLIVLAALAPRRGELVALGSTVVGAAAGTAVVAVLPKVADGDPEPGAQGLVALALLVVLGVVAAAVAARREPAHADAAELGGGARTARRLLVGALVVVIGGASAALTLGSTEEVRNQQPSPNTAGRLGSLDSQRYDYWRVAVDAFAENPLDGVGSGGFQAEWRREQPARSAPASDAHSLYVETAAELGLVGLLALGLLGFGVVLAATAALRRDPVLAAGPIAAVAAFAFHAGLDWDWEMPAVALIAILLAGLLAAAGDCGEPT